MTRGIRAASVLAVLAIAISMLDAIGQTTGTATVVVRVPADARLYFNDALTQISGTTRSFNTPALPTGKDFIYEVRAEVTRQGRPVSQTQQITVRAGQTTNVDFTKLGVDGGAAVAPAAQGPGGTADSGDTGDNGWPRKISQDDRTLTVFQPQIEKWENNALTARAAVSVETKASPRPTFGVIWITGRTEVDKEHRLVTLDNVQVPRVSFPAAEDRSADYLALVRKLIPATAQTVSLDRLQANLAVTQAEYKSQKPQLKNEPPRIVYSNRPALLVLIDGNPVLRQVPGNNLLRAINTRALLLMDQTTGKYYLHLMDRWMEAQAVAGPWSVATAPPASLEAAKQALGESGQVDLLDDLAPDLKNELEDGQVPTVYVSTTPAELIETRGQPQLAPIDGTNFLYVKNTSDQVVFDLKNQDYYLLVSGRWFRSKSLEKGPWEFVPGDKVPADVAKIPDTHPRGDVLASIPGTPQAREALIANHVPQTATISRSEAKLAPIYDGDPKFEPIEETNLSYAVNSPTPVIRVNAMSYYAVENGVWFTASSPNGPWTVATSVPPEIYTIPASSPVNYATNVYVYGSTPDVVYVGYTPGYFGTCVDPLGCIVYGTGWYYRPWIGAAWYGRAWTYGFGAHFGWAAGGWGFGFVAGAGRPWWGPVGWHSAWGGNAWRQGWERGWGGRYNNVHPTNINFNNFSTYNRWNNNARVNAVRNTNVAGSRTTNVAGSRTTNVGSGNVSRSLNNVYAGNDGNVYRRASNNAWETHTNTGWQSVRPEAVPADRRPQVENVQRQLNNDLSARRVGEASANQFRTTTNFGGYGGGASGYRGGAGGGRRR